MTDRTDGQASSAVSNSIRTYTLIILTIVYVFNFIDRQILVILQPLIKAELNLSDTQLGLLTGFAFAIFYTALGLPIARLADRSNRRNIISISLAVWSAMTALSGMAQSYWQLLLARMGVGVGEAGGSPPAHSMISDLYEPKRRATALAIYSAGLYLGVLVGFALGGKLGYEFGWRNTLLIVGLPGLLLALLLRFTVPEPVRGRFESAPVADQAKLGETLKHVFGLKSFPFFAFGCAMAAFVSYGTSNFMPLFMVRYHNIPIEQIGLLLGLTAGGGGIIGTYLGGHLTDRLGAQDPRWYLWLPALSAVIGIPAGIVAITTDNTNMMLGFYFVTAVMSTFYLAPAIAVAHRLVAPRMRALTSAILFFVLNLIGLGLGPVVVGAISDIMREMTGRESLREALLFGIAIAIVKAYLFWQGGRKLPEDIAATTKQ
ncbi:MAG: MFS transporter [Alphaproteobacteria bacterium]|nr:MAG: MFS transporter [Alphaproteobacteria bacterium]